MITTVIKKPTKNTILPEISKIIHDGMLAGRELNILW